MYVKTLAAASPAFQKKGWTDTLASLGSDTFIFLASELHQQSGGFILRVGKLSWR
jgi:hypothetical protein